MQEKLKNLKTDPRGAGLSATQTLDARKKTEEKLNTTRKALIDKEFSQRKEAATKEFSVLRQRLVISKLETNMLNKRIELSNRQLAKEIKTAKAESKRQYNEDLVRVGLMRAAIDQQAREKEISSFSELALSRYNRYCSSSRSIKRSARVTNGSTHKHCTGKT